MRIVHVVRQFYPAIGGFESVVWELATRQAGEGHTVRVITLDRLFKTDKPAKLAARETIAGLDGPFDLLLDLGCFHSLPEERRDAYVAEAGRVARPGATLLLFAFGEKGPGTPVAPEAEIRERFKGPFEVVEVRPGAPFRKQTWYRLRRKDPSAPG